MTYESRVASSMNEASEPIHDNDADLTSIHASKQGSESMQTMCNMSCMPGSCGTFSYQAVDTDELRGSLVGMIGTDHTHAPAEVRSTFVVPDQYREEALEAMRDKLGATGIALLATCNRTELWATFDGVPMPERRLDENGRPSADDPFLEVLCEAHGADPHRNAPYFIGRTGEPAVSHLFHVACGLRSAIVAEDQVISQVKQAIATSREYDLSDGCLEVLFRHAVTAAKHVKSGVRFTRAYATAVDQAISVIEERGINLADTTCMVIGNGEYGRLAASTLVQHGARVLVTVRQYARGYVAIPVGCETIPYTERYEHLAECDIVMSATTSPHYTLTHNEFAPYAQGAIMLFDLAIPRDIDPAIAHIDGYTVFDIDDFATDVGTENAQAIAEAQAILDSGTQDFWSWVKRRNRVGQLPSEGAFFPLFVNLHDKRVVFVGAGTVALRRLRTILPFAGEIDVVAPDATPEVQQLANTGAITFHRKTYDPSCLEGADIVFACTNDPDLNMQIARLCYDEGRMVNVSSDRTLCDFYYPGIVQKDNIVIGISAGGKDHRRVRQLKQRIARLLEEEDI